MQQERIERYIRSRRDLERALHAIRPDDRGAMVHYGARDIIHSLSDSVKTAINKIPGERIAFGYLDQYIEPEAIVRRVRALDKIQRGVVHSDSFGERMRQNGGASFHRELQMAHQVMLKSVARKRRISDFALTRATLYLTEYVTDRPNLRGKSLFEIEQTAFKLLTHLPDALIDFCQRNKACEETYRMLDPWVGMNIDLIKTKI